MSKNRYQYTCPDVIHYRRNQYRLAIWSNVLSIAYVAAFFGGLAALAKKAEDRKFEEAVQNLENQE